MEQVDGNDHPPGVHCGAAALRNVGPYCGWTVSEAAAFGFGGGAAFVLCEQSDEPWVTLRTSPLWLERAYFERHPQLPERAYPRPGTLDEDFSQVTDEEAMSYPEPSETDE